MLVIKPIVPLLLAAAATTVSAGPLFKASPLTISLHHNSSPEATASAAAVVAELQEQQQQQQKFIETLTAKDGGLVTITYTPAETTPKSTFVRASPPPSVPQVPGPRETSISQPTAVAVMIELRDTADSGDDDESFASAATTTASSTVSSDESSSSSSSDSDSSDSSSSSSSEDEESAATTMTAAANEAATTPAPPKNNPAVAPALAQQGYSQETYYSCKTYAATSTHCGWHVPVVYVGDGGAKAKGGSSERGRVAVGAAAACGLVVNYMLG